MAVWVLAKGEHGEGYYIINLYADKAKALKKIETIECHFPGGWDKVSDDRWVNGCDYITLFLVEIL